jgi:hypothetical protein
MMGDVIAFSPLRVEAVRCDRVRALKERAGVNLAALSEDLAELAILLGSPDGSARFGPINCVNRPGLEIVAHIRRRRP